MSVLFRINNDQLSNAIWQWCFSTIEPELEGMKQALAEIHVTTDTLRAEMELDTYPVLYTCAVALYAAVRHIKPTAVFEIGTFIGNSALTIAKAMDVNGQGGHVVTCDAGNEFRVPTELTSIEIIGYPNTTSTAAMQDLVSQGVKMDFIHLDGRLLGEDVELLEELCAPAAVIAIDDFAGVQKGIINYQILSSRPFFKKHMIVQPPHPDNFKKIGLFTDRCTTALMVPTQRIKFG